MKLHHVHSLYPHIPYPMSRHEAELHWEMARHQMRANLETLPSSSFARTMLEEDDLFYTTFPLAKEAAIDTWISQHTLHGPYAMPASQDEMSSLRFEASPASFAHECHPPPPNSPNYAIEEIWNQCSHHPKASPLSPSVRLDYDFYTANGQRNFPGVVAPGQSSVVQQLYHHSDHPFQLFPRSSSPPASLEIIHLASHLLVPSQRRGLNDVSRHLAQTFATEPIEPASDSDNSSATPPCSPSSTCPMLSSPIFPPSCTFEPPQFTGDWAGDAIAADPLLHAPRPSNPEQTLLPESIPWDTPVVDVPPTHHHLTYRHNRNSRSRSRSHRYMPRKSSSPSMSRASSPQPPRKRVKAIRDKDGKPIMACLYCRGRRIACGPPPPGSADQTCSQCARRNLPCNYPFENRRGMRKPKLKTKEDVNVDTLKAMTLLPSWSRLR
ncbi:hypothetical protein D9615_010191 [Tricholomella constricta]|uniref:Zn(2)-C6 fungal-type domain-containing protein n=1 Tax=Tricholomella constricta TaxID=117010 RepID=A0A8H5GN82_9AGAR|nr:hypothetical protein D9615_010191 [Tricholomella constricta]